MKGLLFFCFSFLLIINCRAQNLVPNWSFEDTIQCPDNFGQLNRTQNWFNPTTGTPDYFNSCDTRAGYMNVPNTSFGYQLAHTGNAYSGCYYGGPNLVPSNGREYIEVQLIDTLRNGVNYCISFYVSLANSCSMAISNVGCYLSANSITSNNIFPLPVTPQIENPIGNYLSDTLNWMVISGTYMATGGEHYITIGNFHDDATTDSIRLDQNMNGFYYYVIDDVSVIEVAQCIAGKNDSICTGDSIQLGANSVQEVYYSWQPTMGLSNPTIANPKASPDLTTTYTLTQTQCDDASTSTVTVTINQNCSFGSSIFIPTVLFDNEQLYIQGLESNSILEIFDMRGRLVFKSLDYENDFWAYNIAVGIYFTRLTRLNGEIIKQKLCIVK